MYPFPGGYFLVPSKTHRNNQLLGLMLGCIHRLRRVRPYALVPWSPCVSLQLKINFLNFDGFWRKARFSWWWFQIISLCSPLFIGRIFPRWWQLKYFLFSPLFIGRIFPRWWQLKYFLFSPLFIGRIFPRWWQLKYFLWKISN